MLSHQFTCAKNINISYIGEDRITLSRKYIRYGCRSGSDAFAATVVLRSERRL